MDREEFDALSPRYQVQEVLRVMAEVVDEFGHDYVYIGSCKYVCSAGGLSAYDNKGQPRPADELLPDCIVGQVLARLGYDLATMLTRNNTTIDMADWANRLHQETRRVLRAAQASQDAWDDLTGVNESELDHPPIRVRKDRTWSTALARAEGFASALQFDD